MNETKNAMYPNFYEIGVKPPSNQSSDKSLSESKSNAILYRNYARMTIIFSFIASIFSLSLLVANTIYFSFDFAFKAVILQPLLLLPLINYSWFLLLRNRYLRFGLGYYNNDEQIYPDEYDSEQELEFINSKIKQERVFHFSASVFFIAISFLLITSTELILNDSFVGWGYLCISAPTILTSFLKIKKPSERQ